MSPRAVRLCALVTAFFLQPSFAAESATAVKPSRVIANTVKAQAIVESVNPETREVKLIGADNRRFTVVVDAQVRNFDQIRPRDRLNVEYLESVAIDVLPARSAVAAPDAAGAAVEVAPKGDKPGIKGVEVAEILATITSIDREARAATLLLADGEARTVKVGEEARLDLVDVGDQVRVTTTRAIAIAVTPPKS
jgi:hypothetical protein